MSSTLAGLLAGLLAAAYPGGKEAFQAWPTISEQLERHLPVVGQDMGDRPLADGLQRVQMDRYVGSGRLELVVPRHGLSLDEVLDNHQLVYRGVDGHAQEEDRGAEFGLLQALEANVIELDE